MTDLNRRDSIQATKQIRQIAKLDPVEPEIMEEAISIVGGRLAFLNKVRLFSWSRNIFLTFFYIGFEIEGPALDCEAFTERGEGMVIKPDRCAFI